MYIISEIVLMVLLWLY